MRRGSTAPAAHMARPYSMGLCRMELSRENAAVLDEQIRLVVRYQLDTLNGDKPLREQLQELGRNCYLQGVLDGQQLFKSPATTQSTPEQHHE